METIVHGKFSTYDYNLKIASKSNRKSWSKEQLIVEVGLEKIYNLN